ncbi:beta-lactamase family protein [Kitasatospora sp. NBC_01246]|uniref:serine hydrolase domain-containing protein n=1 Tax=Kitasatospora sp. NBC_01246 TaxID=2903570 RepID=UPI002E363656|nr:serine hydrolase domain-containing protein [Kitasatospora sp. NBC_01246]
MNESVSPGFRLRLRPGGRARAAVAVVAGALTLGTLAIGVPTSATAATASTASPGSGASAAFAADPATVGDAASASRRPDGVQQRLEALVRDFKAPAALATVTGRDGRTRRYTAGVGDLTTGARVPVDGQVRVGSNTKAFTSVVVLQLVGEGKVGLDAFVDTYLPGLLRGDGIDGRNITVRQLLQHTSGLPNYTEYLEGDRLDRYHEPRELLDLALAHPSDFTPGDGWKYSNTGYLVAGMIIQRITGRPVGEEITHRVIDRIGLRHTYFPVPGDTTVHEAHPEGYDRLTPDGPLTDVTRQDMSWGWAAGALVSTNTDLNRFYTTLIGGGLLAPELLAQMRTTVPVDDSFGQGARYGLGLASFPLTCGGVYWGHGGTLPGYVTRGGVTEDGRAANIAVTTVPAVEAKPRIAADVDAALCR